ncbi:MAG: iron ABC transporter ATP-binding protein [Cellvibrionales bacterium]|nr:MAG: iron ABC transporter ATP-binding protein [Cellvibrionales bacterium]
MMLKIDNMSLAYGDNIVLKNINLVLKKGECACLIGPSGSGKSSLLRAIAGFEKVRSGEVSIDGVRVSTTEFTVPPEQRKVGMLFQDLALFPHLTVQQNIAFGLAGLSKVEADKKIAALLELVGLSDFAGRYSHQLSGGQQQRVALARALAPEPDLLLLDEPFSSLDSELRQDLVADVFRILKEKNITTLMVTHDQVEAFSWADKLGVLIAGDLAQYDTPLSVYRAPSSKVVAAFVGLGSFIQGKVLADNKLQTAVGTACYTEQSTASIGTGLQVLIRPENIQVNNESAVRATVVERLFRGEDSLLTLELEGGEKLLLSSQNSEDFSTGQSVGIELTSQAVVAFSANNKV